MWVSIWITPAATSALGVVLGALWIGALAVDQVVNAPDPVERNDRSRTELVSYYNNSTVSDDRAFPIASLMKGENGQPLGLNEHVWTTIAKNCSKRAGLWNSKNDFPYLRGPMNSQYHLEGDQTTIQSHSEFMSCIETSNYTDTEAELRANGW